MSLLFFRRWSWIPLVWAGVPLIPFLAGACKPRPLVCDAVGFFQVLQPQEGAGVAPFSIERLGPEVKSVSVAHVPGAIELTRNNRVRVGWETVGYLPYSDLIFSPSEGLARDPKDPKDVYPMRRYSDGKSERVRFGFRSRECPNDSCTNANPRLLLVAEMTCHRTDRRCPKRGTCPPLGGQRVRERR